MLYKVCKRLALGSRNMPQDPGFQGNKEESLEDAEAQTNDGGKLNETPCKNTVNTALL